MFSSCFQIIHGFSVSKEGWETGCLTGDAPGSVLLDCKERDFCTGAVAEALLQQLWLLSVEVLVPSLGTCLLLPEVILAVTCVHALVQGLNLI